MSQKLRQRGHPDKDRGPSSLIWSAALMAHAIGKPFRVEALTACVYGHAVSRPQVDRVRQILRRMVKAGYLTVDMGRHASRRYVPVRHAELTDTQQIAREIMQDKLEQTLRHYNECNDCMKGLL